MAFAVKLKGCLYVTFELAKTKEEYHEILNNLYHEDGKMNQSFHQMMADGIVSASDDLLLLYEK